MAGNSKERVFVGMSGGVDSSVAALRLQRAGYDVVGVFIKVWHPDFLICDWEQERLDAMRVAAHLGIPFLTCDAEAAYKQDVADYMISEYAAGRTPNPDVMCNKYVKFGVFDAFAREHGADYIATGHYARNVKAEGDGTEYQLLRGVDAKKDQTYFLWTLSRAQLSRTLFPIGDTPKAEIRKEAAAAGLPTAEKDDSQGICFLGHIDLKEFLGHYITTEPGAVHNRAGEQIGTHDGALFYTLGQRHGFQVTTADAARTPHYVVAKDVATNTLVVDTAPPVFPKEETVTLTELNQFADLTEYETCVAQFRYQGRQVPVRITDIRDNTCTLHPEIDIETPAAGQSCVLYDGDRCIGGGIVEG